MEKKYCLKLDGRFAGHYEIFTETEVRWLRDWLLHLKSLALTDEIAVIHDKLSRVLYIASPEYQEYYRKHFGIDD